VQIYAFSFYHFAYKWLKGAIKMLPDIPKTGHIFPLLTTVFHFFLNLKTGHSIFLEAYHKF
jgi:hypothetical protein